MNRISRIKNEDYTTISNVFLKDKDLSIKAKGFIAIIMGLPSNWDFSIRGICSILKEGKTAVYNVIEELRQMGYCKYEVIRDDKGLIIGTDYSFSEEPIHDKETTLRMKRKIEKLNTNNQEPENREMDSKTQLSTNSNKVLNKVITKKEEEEKQDWEKDFNAYYQLVIQAQHQLLHDSKCKAEKEKYHPNLDYELSLEKMVNDYWGTENAWKYKKKSKSKKINMITTLKKAFDISSNRVYKRMQFGKVSQKEIKEQIPKNKNYTRVPLHPELKFVDDEGKLNDGTFVKDGYRYYFSKRDCTTYSIPPAADPKPLGDEYEYDRNNGWYWCE